MTSNGCYTYRSPVKVHLDNSDCPDVTAVSVNVESLEPL